ncbi:MAG: NADPH-dependent F420 reductase [Bryobacteraceae bacterium]
MSAIKIGIIGAGNVGGTLGLGWAKRGHQVVFGSRNPGSKEVRDLVRKAGGGTSAAANKEAVERSEVVVLATPWPATKEAVSSLPLTGKVVIDATNPVSPDLSGLVLGTTTSAAEQVAQWARGADVVKAFNTVGFNVMARPEFAEGKAVMFYCGDNSTAKKTVHQLVSDLGFDARDAGPLTQARYLEPFAMLWITLAFKQAYGLEFGFKLMSR